MKHPAHPGPLVKYEVLDAQGISIAEAARTMKCARPSLTNLLNGKRRMTPKMAVRIERAFQVDADLLMKMQKSHDLSVERSNA